MTDVHNVSSHTAASNGVPTVPLTVDALERAVANRSVDTGRR